MIAHRLYTHTHNCSTVFIYLVVARPRGSRATTHARGRCHLTTPSRGCRTTIVRIKARTIIVGGRCRRWIRGNGSIAQVCGDILVRLFRFRLTAE